MKISIIIEKNVSHGFCHDPTPIQKYFIAHMYITVYAGAGYGKLIFGSGTKLIVNIGKCFRLRRVLIAH